MANLITVGPDVESQPLNDNFAALNDDIVNVPHALYRNAIINGNFDVWQRGTNFVVNSFATSVYTADRWKIDNASGNTITVSRQQFAPGQTDVPNEPRYYIRLVRIGNALSELNLAQRIEDVRTFAGKTVTLSFYAKADKAYNIGIGGVQDFGVGGSSTVDFIPGLHYVVTTSWQKFTFTFDVPSIVGKTIGPNSLLEIRIARSIDDGQTPFILDFAQVQLNAGDVALPFQPRHYTEEFALCRRYCQVYGYGVPGVCRETTAVTLFLPGVYMRVTPTATLLKTSTQIYDGTAAYVSSNSTISPGLGDDNGLTVRLDGFSGLTVGRPVVLDDGRVILLDAEL